MEMEYYYNCYVSKYTFDDKKIMEFISKNINPGQTLNLFAGKNRISLNEIRVDINNEFHPNFQMDAEEFLYKHLENNWKFDNIILDPPYNLRKSMEKYNGNYVSSWKKIVDLLIYYVSPRTKLFTFGYNSNGLRHYISGIKLIGVGLFHFPGEINDIICTIEIKNQKKLFIE